MKFSNKIMSAAFAATLCVGAIAANPAFVSSAFAQVRSAKATVVQAKSDGLVGEQLDGYIGFVTADVSADVRAAVNEINIKRKSVYTRIAREKSVSVSDVAGISGEKLVAKAGTGEMVKLGDGNWRAAGS